MGRLVVDELEGGGGLAEALLNGGATKALGVPEGLDCCEGMVVLLSLLRLNGNLSREVIEDEDMDETKSGGGERERERGRERKKRRRWCGGGGGGRRGKEGRNGGKSD